MESIPRKLIRMFIIMIMGLCLSLVFILFREPLSYGLNTPPDPEKKSPEVRKEISKVRYRFGPADRGLKFPNITCPIKEPKEVAEFWHNICYSNGKLNLRISYHAFYSDARHNEIRTVILTFGNFKLPELFCIYWYDITKSTPQTVKARATSLRVSVFILDNIQYESYLLICSLQNFAMPTHVSLSIKNNSEVIDWAELEKVIDNKAKLVIPALKNNTKDISVCLTTQYGKVTDDDAPFFIQWIEMFYKFGVTNVVMYNSTMRSSGVMYNKALEYYVKKGMLTLIQVPLPYVIDVNIFKDEFNGVEALRKVTVNDCFYRNRLSNWYLIHVDKDEILVPRQFKTYQEFLTDYLRKNPKEVMTPSLAVRSSFYYKIASKAKKGVPSYFPLLQQVTRQPTESNKISPGYSKSFVNPKSCNNVWNHRCMRAGDDRHTYVPDSAIVSHHYRNSCPQEILPIIRTNLAERNCDDEPKRAFYDDFIGEHYGEYLAPKTLEVLKEIGYPIKR